MMDEIKAIRLFRAFREYLGNYLPKVRAKSPNTVKSYQFAINLFNEFIQEQHNKELYEVSMDDYTAENILAFMEWLENSRRNGISTVNQRLFEIRAFCKYLMRNDPLRIEALSAILDIEKRPVPAKGDFIYLDHRRLELLFAQPDIRTKTGIRDRFFLELMYDSGCRDQEMLDLKVKNFIIDRGKVSIKVVGKGNKFRMTPISEKILPSFFRYRDRFLPDNDPESLLFYTERKGIRTPMSDDNVARFMNKYEKMVRESDPEYPHLHPHLLRRSRAMNLYIHGMPLPLISEWLGHTQLETTTIYAQATTEMKRLAANKSDAANSSIFNEDVFKYANDEESLKRLYGLK